MWKLDLWAWDQATFDEKMSEYRQLARSLADADRALILQIKDAVHQRPEYLDTLTSMDVYAFAILGRGKTLRDFDAFVAQKRAGLGRRLA